MQNGESCIVASAKRHRLKIIQKFFKILLSKKNDDDEKKN